MTRHDAFEASLVSLLDEAAQAPIPAGQVEHVLAAIASRQPRPARLAGLGGRWIGGSSSAPIGALRVPAAALGPSAAVLLLLLMTLALIGTATLIGARLMEPRSELERLLYALDGDIFLADAHGGNPARVAEGASLVDGFPWAPDGRHFLSFDPARNMAVIREPDGREVASFPNLPGFNGFPVWSPDSTRLHAWSHGFQQIDIHGLDGALKAELRLPDGYARFREDPAIWAPDGRSVWVRIVRRDGDREVWALPVDGSAPRRLADDVASIAWGPRFTRDGTRMAFSGGSAGDQVLQVANADGTDRRSLSEGVFPAWSPNAQQLAYLRWVPGQDNRVDLMVVDVASGTARTLLADFQYAQPDVTWSATGDRVLFTRSDAAGRDSVWTVGAQGGEPTLLVDGATYAAWQPAPATATPPPAAPTPAASPSPVAGAPIDTAGWTAFTSDRYGFDMAYPPDWATVRSTSDWLFESTPADGWLSTTDHFYGPDRSIRWSAVAVRVPAGMSNTDFLTAYHATWPHRSRTSCAPRQVDLGPLEVDGHAAAITATEPCDATDAFVFVDDRAYVFTITPSAQGALLKALLSTVRFSAVRAP